MAYGASPPRQRAALHGLLPCAAAGHARDNGVPDHAADSSSAGALQTSAALATPHAHDTRRAHAQALCMPPRGRGQLAAAVCEHEYLSAASRIAQPALARFLHENVIMQGCGLLLLRTSVRLLPHCVRAANDLFA